MSNEINSVIKVSDLPLVNDFDDVLDGDLLIQKDGEFLRLPLEVLMDKIREEVEDTIEEEIEVPGNEDDEDDNESESGENTNEGGNDEDDEDEEGEEGEGSETPTVTINQLQFADLAALISALNDGQYITLSENEYIQLSDESVYRVNYLPSENEDWTEDNFEVQETEEE